MSLFQFTTELTNLFPVKEGLSYILNLARDLRKSGSDIVVEHDLANLFGRGKIKEPLRSDFREGVLRDKEILSFLSEINLARGAGPTIEHAARTSDPGYLASVIQLSMLSAFHQRAELTEALVKCITERHRRNYPDAYPDPGFEGVEATLHAISAQTNAFRWSTFVEEIESRIRVAHPVYTSYPVDRRTLMHLTPNMLFAAIDMLYMIQSLPEDRKMLIRTRRGLIIMIIWAHYLLSLTVTVKGLQNGNLTFGDHSSAQVIIEWDTEILPERDVEVLFLDAQMEILFKIEPETLTMNNIAANERHTLRDYGTDWLRDRCQSFIMLENDSLFYQEVANYITAVACHFAKRFTRCPRPGSSDVKEQCLPGPPLPTIERGRVMSAASVIFQSLGIDHFRVNGYCEKGSQALTLNDFAQPQILRIFVERIPEHRRKAALGSINLKSLVGLVVSVACLANLNESSEAPLAFDLQIISTLPFIQDLWTLDLSSRASGLLEASTLFDLFRDLLKGEAEFDDIRTLVFSECGWSLVLDVVGDTDPGNVQPWRIHLKRGVPTHSKTEERRYLVMDLDSYDFVNVPERTIFDKGDKGQFFVPRCVTHVHERKTFVNLRARAFWVSLQFKVKEDVEDNMVRSEQPQFVDGSTMLLTVGYRDLHDALWGVAFTEPCQHSKTSERTSLGAEVVTTNCLDWKEDVDDLYSRRPVHERVCVLLVKGDRWARWLAVFAAARNNQRRVILRCRGTCENCAINLAVMNQGKWLIII